MKLQSEKGNPEKGNPAGSRSWENQNQRSTPLQEKGSQESGTRSWEKGSESEKQKENKKEIKRK